MTGPELPEAPGSDEATKAAAPASTPVAVLPAPAPAAVPPVAPVVQAGAAAVPAAATSSAAPAEATRVEAADPGEGTGPYPMTPVDSLSSWAAMAAVRRQLGSPDVAEAPEVAIAPVATALAANPSAVPVFNDKGIAAAPVVVLADGGDFVALLNATTIHDDVTLVVTGPGGSNGGKVTPNALFNPPPTPGYNPQTVALLPHATWLDGGSRGTERFFVGIREYTDFDNFWLQIPVVGDIVFKPIIHALQDSPCSVVCWPR